MTIYKDWMREAAQIIINAMFQRFGKRDDYMMFDERMQLEESIISVLRDHCPLLPDTAYMPVPQCGTCRWFVTSEHIQPHCTFLHRAVASNFGCIEWRPRV